MTDIARRFAELRSAVANGTYTGPITQIRRRKMDLPNRENIDDMVELIGGPDASFDRLSIPDRMRVIELVNQCDAVTILSTIEDRIDRIDDHLVKVADWFRCSRTYEG